MSASAGFVTAPTYTVGISPTSVVVGDFNGDGIPDLAVSNSNPIINQNGTVSILLGNGDGTFQAARSYTVGVQPWSLAAGDFNSDGHLDLALANPGDNTVSILLGNGDGTFQAAQSFAVGPLSWFVAVGDFNGDGLSDIAVANFTGSNGPGTVAIFLGNGDGTFQAPQSYTVGTEPVFLALADFNGDGHLDLAVANSGLAPAIQGSVSILLGNGDGTFQPAQSYTVGTNASSVAVGDFNGDGMPDLVTTNRDSNTISVLLGKGDGTFQAAQSYAAGIGPGSVAVGDFNGDGHVDLAVTNGLGVQGGPVIILLGNGDGTFQLAHTYTADADPNFVVVADFNQDGHLDLAVSNYGNQTGDAGNVSIFLGKGDGTFLAAPSYSSGGASQSIAVADFNGDGIPDLAVADDGYPNGTVAIFLGNGDGTFQTAGSFPAGAGPVSVTVGDFNGDGKKDILVTNYYQGNPPRNPGPRISGARVFLGNGDGTFQPAHVYNSNLGARFVAVGDFNGDGIPDVVVANYGWFADVGNTVTILLGNGDGTFQAGQSYTVQSGPVCVAIGDFNGDGRLDFAVGGDLSVSVFLGNGDGTFQAGPTYPIPGPSSIAVGDFNGDGHPDLALANENGTVSVLLGNGAGSFGTARSYAVGSAPLSVLVSDVNGDGILDLAVANRLSASVSILLGKGDGTFRGRQDYAAGSRPYAVTAADFNGDGFPDLAVANYFGAITVLINDANWPP